MSEPHATVRLRRKTRRLTLVCLALWLLATALPVTLSLWPPLHLGPWPLDFWMAAQGCLLAYLGLAGVYAWLINRWERQAGESSIAIPNPQVD